jgi:beta-glucosidase
LDYSNAVVLVINKTALDSKYPTGNLSVEGKLDLWDEVVTVTALISNNGTKVGYVVVKLYVQYPDAADQPIRQLRGFQRTLVIEAGQSETVTFSLRRRDLSM